MRISDWSSDVCSSDLYMYTEGLLLLTTDGELKRALELPSSGVERVYRARVFGEVSQAQLEELIHGIEIDGIRSGSIDAHMERRTGPNACGELKLTEDKNLAVRREQTRSAAGGGKSGP